MNLEATTPIWMMTKKIQNQIWQRYWNKRKNKKTKNQNLDKNQYNKIQLIKLRQNKMKWKKQTN